MIGVFLWWLLPDSNWGHKALQASALPAELKSHTYIAEVLGEVTLTILLDRGVIRKLLTAAECVNELDWEKEHSFLAWFSANSLQCI